ncbi:sigma-54-dependent transcriptional regulator [Agaribacterium haliotis]|uniref:sigma-54-dependent transcriptional regulator n=1 Tax=Agaribacterium haliotis TaxID=2013869 RepID=UPI000BB57BF7|nr:sigma-54 dependent transcriptional regulator [Agaribacterium haliotis]
MKANKNQARILVVEDDASLREAVVDTLLLAKMRCEQADSAEQAMAILSKDIDFDLIVSDVNMGDMSGHDLLLAVKDQWPHIPVLLVTAYASVEDSVRAIKDGAVDYLVKPFSPEALIECVQRFVGFKNKAEGRPIAESPSSKQLLNLAERVAASDSTALLLGESGTGKEVLARFIHERSPRADGPFVAVNCAAIPENMLEATLFGHEKGAYTGAYQSAPGKFEQANGGSILLDEISEMDLGLQAKLLRVLQEREVERLGGRRSIKLDVRVIATSNRDMRLEVDAGRFRGDLYFRLNVLPLSWAALRERREDILPLAHSLLDKHAHKQHRRAVSLSQSAQRALLEYRWPGNVRELDNVMQRALILQSGELIEAEHLGLELDQVHSNEPLIKLSSPPTNTELHAQAFAPDSAAHEHTNIESDEALLGNDMKRHEFDIIVKTLKLERGSKKHTAERLGISPRTLRYKIARLREQGFDLEAAGI